MKNIIEGKDIRFSYDGTEVIKGVDISIRQGRMIGLLGANGVGKSTLLKILCGILNIKSGKLFFEEKELRHISNRDTAKRIAYIPQNSTFDFPFTVSEVVNMGRAPYLGRFEFENEKDMQISFQAMQKVGIEHLKDRLITEISGGERQLTSIARALAQEPEIMILDEPVTFLDLKHKSKIMEILNNLKNQKTLTIISATHDIYASLYYFDEIIVLKDGIIFAEGSSDEILREDILSSAYGIKVNVRKEHGRTFVIPSV